MTGSPSAGSPSAGSPSAGSLPARYAGLVRGTGAGPALAASLIGRLALGTTGLALLLMVRTSTGSYATAGLVAAAYAISLAGFSPLRARRADRRGPRGVLLLCAVLHPATLVGLVLLADAGAGPGPLLAGAVLAGATVPPLGGVMRAMWAGLVPAAALTTAYSLEAVVIEICFVAGPLLVAGLSALSGPPAAVLAAGGLVLVGSSWFACTPALRAVVPHGQQGRRSSGPLTSSTVRGLLLTVGWVGAGFGALEVSLPAYAETQAARPGTAGVLLAVWSGGSILGGLVYGAARLRAEPGRQLPWLVAALAVGAALPLVALSLTALSLTAPPPVVMAGVLVLYGLTIAPFSTCNSVLLGAAAPPGTATEAFAWSSSLIFGGAALGNAAGGWLVQHVDVRAGLGLTAATGVLALLSALAARPPTSPPGV